MKPKSGTNPAPRTDSDWLNPGEVARLFGVHPKTLRNWAVAGRLPCILTPGGQRRYRRDEVMALLSAA